jgi:hypothetical protein
LPPGKDRASDIATGRLMDFVLVHGTAGLDSPVAVAHSADGLLLPASTASAEKPIGREAALPTLP